MKSVAALAIVLLGATGLPAADREPAVIADVDRRQIYQGESVRYTVILNHVQNPSPPELRGFDDFSVTPLGERSLNSVQSFTINGRTTTVERRGREYSYRLTPLRAGLLRIPAPVAMVDGKQLSGNELTINVVPPQEQDVAVLEITSDRRSVYPMQPFSVTLSILLKELPNPFSDEDPTRVEFTRSLQIPWVNDERLPGGLEPSGDWQRWLMPLKSLQGFGFSINNIGEREIFSLFRDRPRSSSFHPKPRKVYRPDQSGQEVGYWQYDFTRQFIPKRSGRYTFGPVTLKGTFATDIDEQGRIRSKEDIYAVARPIVVTVKDVPEQGRPDSYIGAVGKFRLSAELHPKKAKVGDPMTLTLTLSGEGTLDEAYPPDLARVAEIAQQFKVYEATEETQGDARQFTYGLRPLKEGIEQFPAVPVSYFDVSTDRYVTLRTDPIPIEVTKADRFSSRQIVAARRNSSAAGDNVQVRQEGIFANITDLGAVRDESVRPVYWLAGLAGAIGLYLVVAAVVWQVRRRSGDVALRRRQAAHSRARTRLRQAMVELKSDRLRQAADHVQAALVGLVADMTDLPEAGLTPRDVEKQLRAFRVEQDLADRVNRLLETCDAARYGTSDAAMSNFDHEAQQLIKPLTRQLKVSRR